MESACTDPRFDDHERRLTDLERGQTRIEASLMAVSAKMSELHGENKVRAEHQERVAKEESEATRRAIGMLQDTTTRGFSVRGWVGWAIVTATSSAVATIGAHLTALSQ